MKRQINLIYNQHLSGKITFWVEIYFPDNYLIYDGFDRTGNWFIEEKSKVDEQFMLENPTPTIDILMVIPEKNQLPLKKLSEDKILDILINRGSINIYSANSYFRYSTHSDPFGFFVKNNFPHNIEYSERFYKGLVNNLKSKDTTNQLEKPLVDGTFRDLGIL